MNKNTQGWLTVAAIILALALVGHMEETEARDDVVCMPFVTPPAEAPQEGKEKTPVRYSF